MLTIEEPRTKWKEETRTEWETVTERVPRRVHETTEDEIVVTKTRNGLIESEELQVRKFPFFVPPAVGRLGVCNGVQHTRWSHLLSGHGCLRPQYEEKITPKTVYEQVSRRVPRLVQGAPRLLLCTRASCLDRPTNVPSTWMAGWLSRCAGD